MEIIRCSLFAIKAVLFQELKQSSGHFPAIAKGKEDRINMSFINMLPSNINENKTAIVRRDKMERIPLHSNPTSNAPPGILSTRPSFTTGIPMKFAI